MVYWYTNNTVLLYIFTENKILTKFVRHNYALCMHLWHKFCQFIAQFSGKFHSFFLFFSTIFFAGTAKSNSHYVLLSSAKQVRLQHRAKLRENKLRIT